MGFGPRHFVEGSDPASEDPCFRTETGISDSSRVFRNVGRSQSRSLRSETGRKSFRCLQAKFDAARFASELKLESKQLSKIKIFKFVEVYVTHSPTDAHGQKI